MYLPPRFGLYSVRQAVRSVPIGHSTHVTAEPVRPAGIGQECAQYRSAEELWPRSDLGCNRELTKPAVVLTNTVRVVKSSLKCERYVFVEKDLRSRAERHPLVPVVLRIAIPAPLVDENWHDGKLVVRLIKHLFCDEEPGRAIGVRGGIIDRSTEVPASPGSILDRNRVIPAVPLKPL